MKKSEKLFLAINEIDDKIIDEAKSGEQEAVRIKVKKHMPIKEIMAFAACFAVLAGAVFGIVRYKLSHELSPTPDNSNSSSTASEPDSNSNSEVKLNFSEQDLELQTILKELIPKAEEIDQMFNCRSAVGDKYTFNFMSSRTGEYNPHVFYLIPADQRTANSLFGVPQSYAEMNDLVSSYFSKWAAEFYMNHTSKGTMTQNADKTYNIDCKSWGDFIEIDGRMYLSPSKRTEYAGLGINCETAKVTRSTDTVIEFTYWDDDLSDFDSEQYSQNLGTLVRENGVWKLHYFYQCGFVPEIPAEYTEQDLELQAILDGLKDSDKLLNLFMPDITTIGAYYNFVFPNSSDPDYVCSYIDVSGSEQKLDFPKSCAEFEQRLLNYFTDEATNRYMDRVCHGNIVNFSDGKYYISHDGSPEITPTYIEIDGKMYYICGAGGGLGPSFYNSAKVVEQTDDTIIFTYAHSYYFPDDIDRVTGKLVFERGGWKRDPFYERTENYSESCKFLLKEVLPSAAELDAMFTAYQPVGEPYIFICGNSTDYYYPVTSDMRTQPGGLFQVPQSRAEMESHLSKYFSKRAVRSYMDQFSTGTVTKKYDRTYYVTTDRWRLTPLIEIDGKVYCRSGIGDPSLDFGLDTVKVIDFSDTMYRFSYTDKNFGEREGSLVIEDGEAKLDYFYGSGILPEYPAQFTDDDKELQDILYKLSPAEIIDRWFNTASQGQEAYKLIFDGLESAESLPMFYLKLPKGTFAGGREQYPQSCGELEDLLMNYFTRETAKTYLSETNKGTITQTLDNNDNMGYYRVKTEKPINSDEDIPRIVEIDGEMYYMLDDTRSSADESINMLWGSAKVTNKTDSKIDFLCCHCDTGINGIGGSRSGSIIKERGGWRLDTMPRR